jgi:polyphosphate kinase
MTQDIFLNRDYSLLEFNRRVLEQALESSTPLLERIRFLAIFSANLDEFFMKRANRLRNQPEVAAQCRDRVLALLGNRSKVWHDEILPSLAANGIRLLNWADLEEGERQAAAVYFQNEVFPVLTPLAVDPSHPFPFLSNLSVSLGLRLRKSVGGNALFARIKIPEMLPQWLHLNEKKGDTEIRLLRLADLIRHHLPSFFPEMIIDSVTTFRATRNADVGHDPDDVEDVLDVVEEELRLRRVSDLVRIQFGPGADPLTLKMLEEELELPGSDFFETPGEISERSLFELSALNRPELKYKPFNPRVPAALQGGDKNIFKVIRDGDLLVQLPYESFDASVERFLLEAANDKKVLAIKIALYRLGDNSPLIPHLIRAAESGKQVVCVVELKARFDEARNISISETLEKSGVHVVYGVVGLKTHSKIALVVRREAKGYRFYGHIGTGNYNPSTARSYTDFGLFTCDQAITADMIEIFNYLTGLSQRVDYKKFLVAPVNMKRRVLECIRNETKNAKNGIPTHIMAKMNSLEEPEVCQALYEASQAGVQVDLVIRGICCLRPGVPGLSEHIRVTSVVGRFLEHSRFYYFRNGAKKTLGGLFFIGSSDWMTRNLSERVETAVPVEKLSLKESLWSVMKAYLADTQQSWELRPDGSYVLLRQGEGKGVQEQLLEGMRA